MYTIARVILLGVLLAGCYTNGTYQQVTYCNTKAPKGVNPKYVVRDQQGCVIGADPDPFIRGQLRRDPPGKESD